MSTKKGTFVVPYKIPPSEFCNCVGENVKFEPNGIVCRANRAILPAAKLLIRMR